MIAAPAMAQQFEEMKVTNFDASGAITSIVISNTTKGVQVSCALFDANGDAVAATTALTENLATEVLIKTPDIAVADAKCVVSN